MSEAVVNICTGVTIVLLGALMLLMGTVGLYWLCKILFKILVWPILAIFSDSSYPDFELAPEDEPSSLDKTAALATILRADKLGVLPTSETYALINRTRPASKKELNEAIKIDYLRMNIYALGLSDDCQDDQGSW